MSTVTADRAAQGAPAAQAAADRDASRVPVRRLTVLHDAECSLCGFLCDWLRRQPQLVPLEFVPAGSAQACARYSGLDHRATLDEITVVGDAGQVYRGAAAWIVTLWALREHRALSHRLSTPAGAKVARAAVLAAARWRQGQEQAAGWGGGVYRRGDGWSYDPQLGWLYDPPACAGGACATD